MRKKWISLLALVVACNSLIAQDKNKPYQVPMLSPQDALASFEVADGYELQLVAHEPMVEEPVTCAFDANGRMYVAEMRTYMQDIDGKDQFRPISRVVRLEDTDGDGVMDKSSVFADGLILPRMILPLDDRVIIRETNTFDLWSLRDTDDDGVADEKIKIHEGGRRGGNLEHQPSGLVWSLDNWLYTTYSSHRYRFTRGKIEKSTLPAGSGQWGLTMDDVGKLYYSTAGGEQPAMDFQQPIVYGRIRMPGELARGFKEVFPIDNIPDVQGGRGRVRSDNTLNAFTGCGGQGVFRGDRLPEDIRGDLIIPEAVGRLVRRARIRNVDGKSVLENVYPGTEFIRTKDPNFRPLCAKTGPDGCLYIVDMYRGIIQEGSWVRPGSYLRGVVAAYGLDKNIGKGRIYRVVHKDFKPGPKPRMLEASTEELVANLSHENGWWRDTAQKLLILRKDEAAPALLRQLARTGKRPLGRMHALWTLEGLDAIEAADVKDRFDDHDARVRAAAVRISEGFLRDGPDDFTADLRRLAADHDPNVSIQVLLSAQITALESAADLVERAVGRHPDSDAVRVVIQSQLQRIARVRAEREKQARIKAANQELAKSFELGRVTFQTLCVQCHGQDGKGTPSPDKPGHTLAPPLSKSPRVLGSPKRLARILLHGLTGPVDDKTYTELMVPMGSNDDAWIASVLNYTRNSFGNNGAYISPAMIARTREAEKDRTAPWTLAELHQYDPEITSRRSWKLSASHNSSATRRSIDGNLRARWDTGTPQVPGMWFQIEFPTKTRVTGLELDSRGSARDFPASYIVRYSDDGKNWSEPVVSGEGRHPVTKIEFEVVTAKFLRIEQTGSKSGLFWSIHDLKVFAAAPRKAPASTAPLIAKLPPFDELVAARGDSSKGQNVFVKRCTTCHQIGKTGKIFGPNLSDVGKRLKKPDILNSILTPNATIDPKYKGITFGTRNGTFLSGLIQKEDAKSVTVLQPDGKEKTLQKRQIIIRQEQKTSFMPADLEKVMQPQELIDLVEFLTLQKGK